MTKKWFVILVVALFFVPAAMMSAADQPPKKIAKFLKKADKASSKQEFETALENYNKAKELEPNYSPIYIGIARIQIAQKQFEDAILNMEKAIQLDTENVELKKQVAARIYQLGKESLVARDLKKANEYFLKIAAIPGVESLDNQLYTEILFQIANNFSILRKYDKSNEYFTKLSEVPDLVTTDAKLLFQVYYKMGLNFYNMKKFKESNQYFEKLVSMPDAQNIDPKFYSTTHYLIGLNASQNNQLEKSTKYLEKFLELNSDETIKNPQLEPLAHYIVGSNKMSDLDVKVQAVRDAKPKDMKEQIKKLADEVPEIADHLTTAIAANPELEPAYMHLGNFYYYSGDQAKAIEFYKTLIEKFPLSPDIDAYKQFLSDLEKTDKKKK